VRVGTLQFLLLLLLWWAGAAAIAIAVNYWMDEDGMTAEQTEAQIRTYVDDKLDAYATTDDIRNVQDYLTEYPPDRPSAEGDVSGMKATVARLLLIMSARGLVIPEAIHSSYFPTGSDEDFQSCMALLQNTAEVQTGGSVEACFRLEELVTFE
jgi:hypothetical protein